MTLICCGVCTSTVMAPRKKAVLRPGRHRIKKGKTKRKAPVKARAMFPTPAKLLKLQKFPRGSPWAISGVMLI